MKVTFDTCTWQQVVLPERYKTHSDYLKYQKINRAIQNKNIIPFISETIFTLEAINRTSRLNFIRSDTPNIQFTQKDTHTRSASIGIVIGPNLEIHPGNNEYAKEYLEEALKLGFNIISLPRVGGITNSQVKNSIYVLSDNEIERMHDVVEKIEQILNAGAFQAMEIGYKYDARAWYIGLSKAPDIESKRIDNAIAEWSDGDSIAAHIGINGDYFCTSEKVKGKGAKTVFSIDKLKYLEDNYNFKTIRLAELSDKF